MKRKREEWEEGNRRVMRKREEWEEGNRRVMRKGKCRKREIEE